MCLSIFSSSANIYARHNLQFANLWKWCNWAINQATKWTTKSASSAFPTSVWHFFLDTANSSAQICAFKWECIKWFPFKCIWKAFRSALIRDTESAENRQSFKEFSPVQFNWILKHIKYLSKVSRRWTSNFNCCFNRNDYDFEARK